jgi:anti-anti-sigma regulatory factor
MRRPGLPTGLVRGVPVITAPENLDRSNTRLLLAAVRYWAAYGYASFVIDMSRTVVCDRPAFRTMVRIHGRAQAEGGEVRVVASAPVMSRFGRGLAGTVLPHFATVSEAIVETPAVAIDRAWVLSA